VSLAGENLKPFTAVDEQPLADSKRMRAQDQQIAARLRALFEAWDKRNIAPIFLNPQEIRQQQQKQ
jgi:hypothetical protein